MLIFLSDRYWISLSVHKIIFFCTFLCLENKQFSYHCILFIFTDAHISVIGQYKLITSVRLYPLYKQSDKPFQCLLITNFQDNFLTINQFSYFEHNSRSKIQPQSWNFSVLIFCHHISAKVAAEEKKKKEREALGDKVSFFSFFFTLVPDEGTHFTLALKYILPLYKVAVLKLGITFFLYSVP